MGSITDHHQDPNIFLVKTPAKPTRIIPNLTNPFQPFRPSVAVRPPHPPQPNTFLPGLNQIKTFKPTTTLTEPSKAPPVFFHSEHSNVATRVPVVSPSRPSVMPEPPRKAPVKPITNVEVSFIQNSILPETRGPISSLKENPTKTTISPATQFFSANPDPIRFKPSPKIPINSLIPVAGNVRQRPPQSVVNINIYSEQPAQPAL